MPGASITQQGPLGVAASITRSVEKPEARSRMRVDDSTHAELGRPLPNRVNPVRARQQNGKQDQALESPVAAATLLDASLIASTLINTEEAGFASLPLRVAPWQPPSSSLQLRDRSV